MEEKEIKKMLEKFSQKIENIFSKIPFVITKDNNNKIREAKERIIKQYEKILKYKTSQEEDEKYYKLIKDVPLPKDKQIVNFIKSFSGSRSWYKGFTNFCFPYIKPNIPEIKGEHLFGLTTIRSKGDWVDNFGYLSCGSFEHPKFNKRPFLFTGEERIYIPSEIVKLAVYMEEDDKRYDEYLDERTEKEMIENCHKMIEIIKKRLDDLGGIGLY